MPTKGTPQLYKRAAGSFNLCPVSDEGFEKLETLLGVKIPVSQRRRIQEVSQEYIGYCKVFQDNVLWRDSVAALEKIIKGKQPFSTNFDAIDSWTGDMLISAGHQNQNKLVEELLMDDHKLTAHHKDAIVHAAKDVLNNRSGKRGGKFDRIPVRQFCYELKPVYEHITGKRATPTAAHSDLNTPPSLFVQFVDTCLKIVLTEKGYRQDALNSRVVSDCALSIIKK